MADQRLGQPLNMHVAKYVLWGLVIAVSACSTYQRQIVTGENFRHVSIVKDSSAKADSTALHIYIDGDGSPFSQQGQVASDPSPRRPYALQLLKADPSSAVLVGRPCYHGTVSEPPCNPSLWTSHRYATEVVNSMVTTINKISQGRSIILVGYSGGGTLAMLIAPKVEQLIGVITIAGNLDIHQWASIHGYTPLTGSNNPIDNILATYDIPQIHFVGALDQNIPPALILAHGKKFPTGSIRVLPKHDHDCCWVSVWPDLLQEAANQFAISQLKNETR